MLSTRRWGWGALLCSLVLVAPASAAEQAALAQVPAEAPLVLQIRGIERTKDRLLAMIKTALPEHATAAQTKLEEGLQKALEGRSLKAVVPDGPVFLLYTGMPGQENAEQPVWASRLAIMVRVTNYADFRTGILTEDERKSLKKDPAGYDAVKIQDQDFYLVDRKGYAVLTPSKEVAVELLKEQPSLAGKLDKRIAAKLVESDVGLYINLEAVNKAYGPQIAQIRQLVPFLLQQQASQVEQLKANAELIKQGIDRFFQGLEDSRALLLAFDFRPEGFALHLQDQVGADTQTNGFLKGSKPSALADMARMPGSRMIYSGMHLDPNLIKALQSLVFGIQAGDNASKEYKDAVEELVAAGPESRLDAMNMPIQGLQVWKYKEPAKAADAQLKLIKALGSGEGYQNAVLKDKPEIKANAEKHRGFSFHSVSLVWDMDKMVANSLGGKEVQENVKKTMEETMQAMLGKGMKIWFGSDGKALVQLIAKDWESARSLLDQYLDGKDSVGQEPAFQAARKQMPAEATFLTLMDVRGYAQIISGVMKPLLGDKLQLPAIVPAGKGKQSYLGMAFTLQPEHGSADLWIPGSAVHTVYELFVQPNLK